MILFYIEIILTDSRAITHLNFTIRELFQAALIQNLPSGRFCIMLQFEHVQKTFV